MVLGMEAPFNKILVANRGEIAVRVIRAAHEMGIEVVAVYSDADKDALHVKMADEAVRIGPPPAAKSYLQINSIVEAALISGAEAVHPGYGFLAENPAFVEELEKVGIVFIGPPASVQRRVGRKLDLRKFFHAAGVPVVPGTLEPVSKEDAFDVAENMGYPVVVKPAGGGGGIGVTIVWDREDLDRALETASSIAYSSFGDPEVYIEKYIARARHIEVQILGDKKGNIVHLFERECSVQRRFQKVIEESPSPALDDELREKLVGYAVKAAKAVGYVNAGTFEFLYDPAVEDFYLLEVNSRIQVEHPVTEMVTGVDLVKAQFMIAAGDPLPFSQEEIELRGHAFEARIYAEDPLEDFTPSPGVIEKLVEPSGPWVRVDSGVYEGYEVTPYYDPLLMKIIVWGRTREEARLRMLRALDETVIEGLRTNLDLHRFIFRDETFKGGDLSTRYIYEERVIERLKEKIGSTRKPTRHLHKKEKEEEYRGVVDAWRLASKMGV